MFESGFIPDRVYLMATKHILKEYKDMATEYERIDNLMKAIAGLISPHIECTTDNDGSIRDFDDDDLSDMQSNIEDSQSEISDLSHRIDSIESDIITTDNISEHIVNADITDEIDDRVRQKFNDDFNENIRDFFDYDGGGDIISEHIDSNIGNMIREEVQAQLSPERLVSMFIEGLSEAINGNTTGRYTVTVKDSE